MIYLLDGNQEVIKIVRGSAVISAIQTQELPEDNSLLRDYLSVRLRNDGRLFNAQYMAVKSHGGNRNAFDLYRIASELVPDNATEFMGVQVAPYELEGVVIEDLRPQNRPLNQTMNQVLEGSDWRLGYVSDNLPNVTTNFYYVSVKDALKKIQELLNVEMLFKVEISGDKITDKWVEVYHQLGNRTMKRFNYGTNALSVVRESSHDELYTALIGRGKGEEVGETESGDATYGRKINFADVEWKKSAGKPVDKPKGQKYVELPNATAEYGIKLLDGRKVPRIGIVEFSDTDDPEKLIQETYQELLVRARPKVLFKANVINTGDMLIGDTVTIHRHDLGFHYQARVRKVVRDRKSNNKTQVEIGDVVHTPSTKRQGQINSALNNVASGLENVRGEITEARQSADGKNTNFYGNVEPVRKKVGDTWFRDHPSLAGESQILVWNGEAWELIIDSADTTKNAEAIDEAKKVADDAVSEINTAVENAGFTSLDETIGHIDTIANNAQSNSQQAVNDASEAFASAQSALSGLDDKVDLSVYNTTLLDLEADIDSAITAGNTAKETAEGLITQVEDIGTVANSALQEAKDAVGTANTAKTSADNLSTEVSGLKTDVEGFELTVNNYQDQVSQFSADVDGFQSTVASYETEVDEFGNIVSTNTTQVNELRNDIDGFESLLASYDEDLDGFNTTVSSFRNTLEGLESTVASYETEVDEYGNEVATYATELSTLRNTVNGFESTVAEFDTTVTGYQTSLATLTNTVDGFESTVANYETQVDEYGNEVSSYATEVATLENTVNGFNSLVASFTEEAEGYSAEVSEFRNTVSGLQSTVASYEVELDEYGNTVDSYATQVATFNNTLDGLESSVTAYEQTVSGYTTQLVTLTNTVDGFNSTVTRYETQLDEYGAEVNQYATEVSTMRNTVSGFESTVATYGTEVSGLAGEVVGYKNQVSTLNNTVDGFNSVVTQVQYDLDNLEIGGRNYWITPPEEDLRYTVLGHNKYHEKTKFMEIGGYATAGQAGVRLGEQLIIDFRGTHSISNITRLKFKNLEPNQEYTFQYTPSHEGNLGDSRMFRLFEHRYYTSEDDGKHFTTSFTTDDVGVFTTLFFQDNSEIRDMEIVFKVDNIKLEKGTIATDWTPAPEDTTTLINHVESELTQKHDTITASVSNIDGRVATNKLSLDGLTTTVQSVREDLTGTTTLLNTTRTTVNGHTSSISTLRTDVDGKATTAQFNTLNSTVNGTITRVGNAEGKITTLETNVNGLQTTVASKAAQSQVTQLSNSLTSTITAVEGNTTQISQNATNINLRVKEGDVLSQINVEAGRTLIQSNKLVLNATNTTISGTTWMNGAVIQNGTISNAKIGSLDVSKISGNTSNFVRTAWNGISSRMSADSSGLKISTTSTWDMNLGNSGITFTSKQGALTGALRATRTGVGDEAEGTYLIAEPGYSAGLGRRLSDGNLRASLYIDGGNGDITVASNIDTSGIINSSQYHIGAYNRLVRYTGTNVRTTAAFEHRAAAGSDYDFATDRIWSVGSTTAMTMHAHLNMNGNTITNQSDIRMKKNITDSGVNALKEIERLNFVNFEWDETKGRDLKPRGVQFGIIAQHSPFLQMKTNDEESYLSVDLTKQVNLNSKASQELLEYTRSLEKRIEELEGAM